MDGFIFLSSCGSEVGGDEVGGFPTWELRPGQLLKSEASKCFLSVVIPTPLSPLTAS